MNQPHTVNFAMYLFAGLGSSFVFVFLFIPLGKTSHIAEACLRNECGTDDSSTEFPFIFMKRESNLLLRNHNQFN